MPTRADDPDAQAVALIDLTQWSGGTITLYGVIADSITENMSTFPASHISQGTGSFDLMIGGGDILDSQQGDATLYGGDGNDTISGYRDNDMLHGGAGNEILWGDKCGPDRMEENIFVCPLLEPEDAASYSPASSWHASIAA